ncbi:hypothetical protein P4050_16570 [Pseudomonas aeruginosa]|nr:hypothetical protein [Pseudomonas aeruginosa]
MDETIAKVMLASVVPARALPAAWATTICRPTCASTWRMPMPPTWIQRASNQGPRALTTE